MLRWRGMQKQKKRPFRLFLEKDENMPKKRWKVFYADAPDEASWFVYALTKYSAILDVGNSEGLDFSDLEACECCENS